MIVLTHSSKLSLQNFHMTQYLVFRKLDWGSWKTSSKKYNLYSSMQFYFLFRTVKTTGPHLIPIKSYSKNTHLSSFLKWIIVKTVSKQKNVNVLLLCESCPLCDREFEVIILKNHYCNLVEHSRKFMETYFVLLTAVTNRS